MNLYKCTRVIVQNKAGRNKLISITQMQFNPNNSIPDIFTYHTIHLQYTEGQKLVQRNKQYIFIQLKTEILKNEKMELFIRLEFRVPKTKNRHRMHVFDHLLIDSIILFSGYLRPLNGQGPSPIN